MQHFIEYVAESTGALRMRTEKESAERKAEFAALRFQDIPGESPSE